MQLLYCLVLLFGVFAAGSEDEVDPDVIVLTDKNFDQYTSSDLILVEFYAPWCGHCKSLKPEFSKAATVLKANDPPILLAKVDATAESALASRYAVSGYPTLFVFRNGKETKYEGPRKADGIIAYMKKQVGPAAKPLTSKEEVEKFTKSDQFSVVGFFVGGKHSQLHSAFLLVASKKRDNFIFGKVTDPAVAKEFGVEGEAIVAFKDFDERKVVYNGSPKTSDVQSWVEQHSVPLVGEYTEANAESYQKRNLPVARLFAAVDWKNNEKQTRYYVNRLKKAAEQFKGKVIVTYANKANFDQEVSNYGLKDEEHGVVIETPQDGKKFRMEEKFSADNVLNFFKDFEANKLRPYVRSEKVPEKNNGPVKTVVALTFNEIVNDPEKDVLIEFYAPWCGHCKSLAPKYEELGRKLQNVDSVTVAKIDATANDYDRSKFEVSGFPTIFLVPAKDNATPIKYEGDREVDAMYKFIKQKAKKKFGKKGKE